MSLILKMFNILRTQRCCLYNNYVVIDTDVNGRDLTRQTCNDLNTKNENETVYPIYSCLQLSPHVLSIKKLTSTDCQTSWLASAK